MATEVEAKFSADAEFRDRVLVERLHELGRVMADETFEQRDTYLDGPDDDLARAGLSARLRRRGDALAVEVKAVPIDAGLVMARAELTGVVPAGASVGDVLRDLLATQAGLRIDGDPRPTAELRTTRRRVLLQRGDAVIEVCLDQVDVHEPEGPCVGSFAEVEFELERGESDDLEPLTAVGLELGLTPSARSKYLRARELLRLPPYEYGAQAPDFEVSTAADAVARAVCLHQLRVMRSYEPGTRVGLDAEQLHKMRVASRRLRTALRVFRRHFAEDERKALSTELKWIGRLLGTGRDLDVQTLAVPTWRASFGPEPKAGWDALLGHLETSRAATRAALREAFDGERYVALCRQAEQAFAPAHATGERIGPEARRLLHKRVARFHEGIARYRETHAAQDAHALRILGKRLRYTAEFLRPLLPDGVREGLKKLSAFQDALGDMQDAIAAGAFARDLAADPSTPTEAPLHFVLGQLAGAAVITEALGRGPVDAALGELDVDALLDDIDAMTEPLARSG